MASGKETPRQKMINLMYLVFISMLALNMSKEVLAAFGLMNEKMEVSNEKMTENNVAFFSGLETKASENPEKFGPLLSNAKAVKQLSESYDAYLENLKKGMQGTVDDPMDYQVMDKSDFLDQLFFQGDELREEGQAFLDNLENYRKGLLEILPESMSDLRTSVTSKFETGDSEGKVTDRDGNKVDWMKYHYEGFPLIASLTKITSIQADVKTTEQDILKTLLEGQLTSEISMSNYTTLLEQEKSAFYYIQ